LQLARLDDSSEVGAVAAKIGDFGLAQLAAGGKMQGVLFNWLWMVRSASIGRVTTVHDDD
jgi:hypothetical protein